MRAAANDYKSPYSTAKFLHASRLKVAAKLESFELQEFLGSETHTVMGENQKDAMWRFALPTLMRQPLGTYFYCRVGAEWWAVCRDDCKPSVERVYQ